MTDTASIQQEAIEDVFFGQAVIIGARWFLIVAGIMTLVWTAMDKQEPITLLVGVVPLIALMGLNFYVHGSYLLSRPLNRNFILFTSLLDLVVITLLVIFWPDQRGLSNQFFIFYYPLVVAFAFSMHRRFEVAYTVIAILAYSAAVLPTFDFAGDIVALQIEMKSLIIRLIALGAMGGLGNYYFRIYRRRRRAAKVGVV